MNIRIFHIVVDDIFVLSSSVVASRTKKCTYLLFDGGKLHIILAMVFGISLKKIKGK